jgi:hypothetical protein
MIAVVVVLLGLIGGCSFQYPVYWDDLVAGYSVCAADVKEQAAILLRDRDGRGGIQVVPAMVFAYGWNDDFIIAKRLPADYGEIKSSTTQWYIVQVQNRKVHGPLSEVEFQRLRAELGVPTELSFTKEIAKGRTEGGSP